MCDKCKTDNCKKTKISGANKTIIMLMAVAAIVAGFVVNAYKNPAKQYTYNGSAYYVSANCLMLNTKGKTAQQLKTDLDSLLAKAQVDHE